MRKSNFKNSKLISSIFLILVIFLGWNCGNKPSSQQESNEETEGLKEASHLKMRARSPISSFVVEDLKHNFALSYLLNINQHLDLDIEDFKVRWNSLATSINLPALEDSKNLGIAFYYILESTDNCDTCIKHFNYAITYAEVGKTPEGNDTIVPKQLNPTEPIEFLVPQEKDTFKVIQMPLYLQKKQHYLDSVYINRLLNPGTSDRIKNISHPIVCFYEGKDIYKFFTDNTDSVDIFNDLYLTLHHGAMLRDIADPDGNKYNYKVQTPILIFKENDREFLSNRMSNFNKPYQYQALDVGRLCPPECD